MNLPELLIGSLLVSFTLIAAASTARRKAWAWLATVVVLTPLGGIAWFVAGRRFYTVRPLDRRR